MRLTVRQNLTVFAMLYGVRRLAGRHRLAGRAISISTELLDRPTGKLSSGQKTRVSLAKALLNQPEVLLLDEPTASLDPDTADWVRGAPRTLLLRRTRRDRAARLAQHERGRAPVRARHHHEDKAESRTTTRRPRCSRATDATPRGGVSRCGARPRCGRPRNEEPRRTACRARISARRIGAMVRAIGTCCARPGRGSSNSIYWPAVQMLMWGFLQTYIGQNAGFFARAGGAFIGAVLLWDILFRGPARLLDVVPRGNVVAQSRQPDDEPAQADGVRRRADDHEPRAARHRHGAGVAARDRASSASISMAMGLALGGLLRQSDSDQLGGRHFRLGARAAQRPRARRTWPGPSCSCFLPLTCVYYPVSVLPRLAADRRLGAAADLCL